jgi:multiple sugar transport system permease protein
MAKMTTSSASVARPARASRPFLWTSKKGQDRIIQIAAIATCVLGVLIILFPLGWMLSTSLKTRLESIQIPPTVFPDVPQWQNYADALIKIAPFGTYFMNTMFYAGMVMIGEVLSCTFVAYGFARLRAPGKNFLFVLVLSTMLLPWWVTLIPQYMAFAKIHWLNSYLPLIVPHFFGSAYLIFLLRQFYRGLPKDYEEAAIIDGANYLGIWLRIILPLSLPAIGAVAILSFMFHYQDYNGPLIYLNDQLKYPISLGLQQFQAPFGGTAFNLLMAASLASIIPPIIVFFVAQRYFIQGIVVSGVKG